MVETAQWLIGRWSSVHPAASSDDSCSVTEHRMFFVERPRLLVTGMPCCELAAGMFCKQCNLLHFQRTRVLRCTHEAFSGHCDTLRPLSTSRWRVEVMGNLSSLLHLRERRRRGQPCESCLTVRRCHQPRVESSLRLRQRRKRARRCACDEESTTAAAAAP